MDSPKFRARTFKHYTDPICNRLGCSKKKGKIEGKDSNYCSLKHLLAKPPKIGSKLFEKLLSKEKQILKELDRLMPRDEDWNLI